jgi:RNA polymerase sigma-70 factor (ECF subfamily)
MDATTVIGRWIPWVASEQPELDWDAVYAEQLPRVLDYFRYRVGNRADAEDLASLTFEKAWRARAGYRRDRASVGTWLMAIARNVAIDHYRSRRLRVTAPLEEADGIAGGETPEERAVRRSEAERLARMLEDLTDRERELVSLKYGAGFSNREIARLTRLTETNVGSILHRAVKALRARWDEGDPR